MNRLSNANRRELFVETIMWLFALYNDLSGDEDNSMKSGNETRNNAVRAVFFASKCANALKQGKLKLLHGADC